MSSNHLSKKIQVPSDLTQKIQILKAFSLDSENIEIHVNLNINPKIPDNTFFHKCNLPHRTGKNIKILAFVHESMRDKVLSAGADFIADEESIKRIQGNKIFFDVCIATPESLKMLSSLAKILGSRGLMPNAKLGTLTPHIIEAIGALKEGQISLKNDRYGILHVLVGKCNSPTEHIQENIEYLIDVIQTKKPSSVKGTYMNSVYLSTTHGPSLSF